MEVKIKNNEEMIDATIEVKDGIMIVSPKEVKWEPKDNETYYFPIWFEFCFRVQETYFNIGCTTDNEKYENGWCFKTIEDCQKFCDKLNDAINQVKP